MEVLITSQPRNSDRKPSINDENLKMVVQNYPQTSENLCKLHVKTESTSNHLKEVDKEKKVPNGFISN